MVRLLLGQLWRKSDCFRWGKPLEEWLPKDKEEEHMNKVKESYKMFLHILKQNGADGKGFLTGDQPVWADFVVAGTLVWLKVTALCAALRLLNILKKICPDKWEEVKTWHDGAIAQYFGQFAPYMRED